MYGGVECIAFSSLHSQECDIIRIEFLQQVTGSNREMLSVKSQGVPSTKCASTEMICLVIFSPVICTLHFKELVYRNAVKLSYTVEVR